MLDQGALMAYFVELSGVLDIAEPAAVDAEERSEFLAGHLSDVMDELRVLEHDILFASSADATLSTGAVEITLGVRVSDPIAATQQALTAIRAAVHTAGGFTPDRPDQTPPRDVDWGLRYTSHRQHLAALPTA
jgi:hypothetical protein